MARRRQLLLLLAAVSCSQPAVDEDIDVPVRVRYVALDARNAPVVVLEEEGGPRLLPIWIGMDAAHSISLEMEQQSSPRPNTHDLAKRVIRGLEGSVARVVVTELRDGTYYATLNLASRGTIIEIDARPSDAIAIALRTKSPIFVRATVFEEAGDVADPESDEPGSRRLAPRRTQPTGSSPATPEQSL
jgi:bifunctional DNase/RNase